MIHPLRRANAIPDRLRKTPIDVLMKMSKELLYYRAGYKDVQKNKTREELINEIKQKEMVEVLVA